MIMFKLISIVCCIAAIEAASPLLRHSVAISEADKIPNIDDLLAVAKSPLEPVTIAMSLPGARNDNQSLEQEKPTTKSVVFEEQQRTSRSPNFVEQERDTTTAPIGELPSELDDTTEAPIATTQTESTTISTSNPPPETSSTKVETSEPPKEAREATTVTVSASTEKEIEPITSADSLPASSESPATTTEEALLEESTTTTTTTTTTASKSTKEEEERKEESEPTTTEPSQPEPTTSGSTTTTTVEFTTVEPERVALNEIATTTEQPETSTLRPIPSITEISVEVSSATEPAAESSSSTGQPAETPKVGDDSIVDEKPTETPAREEPSVASTTKTTTEAPTTTTTTEASTTTISTTTTTTPPPPPSPTTTETPAIVTMSSTTKPVEVTTSAPEATQKETVAPVKENPKAASCNHLPSYESDELQKVFREETTYKNGTIKGKFTYINFDQRYRLVHYTRLPYGPVKIDLVEELGKPERPGQNKTDVTNTGEIPNAVLQLRNILPNSLFGFPFLGPISTSSGSNSQQPPGSASNKDLSSKDDKTSQYFYSTDSISTPNLLTPNVPVSLLPNQQRVSNTVNGIPAADTLSQSYYENLPVGGGWLKQTSADVGRQTPNTNQQQFQYAINPPQDQEAQPPKASLIYGFSQPQYQYSPLPLSWQNFYSNPASNQQVGFPVPTTEVPSGKLSSISAVAPSTDNNSQEQQQIEPLTPERTHQPHSHEHFVAPFMFTNPRVDQQQATSEAALKELQDQPETRLKLRVKTSKSLNHQDSFGKSAQLRSPQLQQQQDPTSGSYLQSSLYSQAQRTEHRNPRQRAGKQHFEVRTPINSNPIVYHVLRSPFGKMYTLSQYNNLPYSLA